MRVVRFKQQDGRTVADGIPLGRFAQADDIVNAVMFLASPLANYITGAILSADGGTYAGS